jgi:hypothetical protein
MIYLAAVFLVVLPVVSGQQVEWGQCKWNKSFNDDANSFRRWNFMDWTNYMCFWDVLHLL